MASTRRKVVIDRIEEGIWAVLLVGRKDTEMVIPVEQLPEGTGPGSRLRVRIKDNRIVEITLDAEETEKVQRRVRSKLGALRRRGRCFTPLDSDE